MSLRGDEAVNALELRLHNGFRITDLSVIIRIVLSIELELASHL